MEGAVTTLKQYRSRTLKDYSIMVEYKRLRDDPPAGVYLLPSFGNSRLFYGVIFLDKGLYKNAVFKFSLALPEDYPAENALPKLIFSTKVFHPLVNPDTMELDLGVQYPHWKMNTERHNIHGVMRFLKRIFYLKDMSALPRAANPRAAHLVKTNQTMFIEFVEDCVQASVDRSLRNEPGTTLRFTEYSRQHDIHLRRILSEKNGHLDKRGDARAVAPPANKLQDAENVPKNKP